MNLFVDYIQPFTHWLQVNPHWALFFTFFISLTESVAVIGSIIPGSITMTAIGIMAGSGIMRIDLTLIAAILGAVCGDGLSYLLGYFYSDQIADKWPFKKYPALLAYGKDFFDRHGGKSVFLGRFVGPLRSIIPVIAGIMHMPQWRFFLANFFSAVGWAFLYVIPGVLIGAASHELSAESATRLILVIFIILVGIWLLGIVVRWLLTQISNYLKKNLHTLWLKLKNHPLLFRVISALTPHNEVNHYPTVALLLLTLFYFICFLILLIFTLETDKILLIDRPIHLLAESFHTSLLEAIFIISTQLTTSFTIVAMFITASTWFILQKDLRAILYSISTIITSAFIAIVLSYFIQIPRPSGVLVIMPGSSFLAIQLVVATAFYGFLLFYIKTKYCLLTNSLRTFTLIILSLSGIGSVYLGDFWFTNILASLCCGATIGLIHCLVYRKKETLHIQHGRSTPILSTLLAALFIATALSSAMNFKTQIHNHTPYHKEYSLLETTWWNQSKPILPLFRFNRIGKRMSLLNIQFSGDLNILEHSLAKHGWEQHNETLFNNLLLRLNNKSDTIKLPLFSQLYENKRPELIMTFQDSKTKQIFELRIWESNYYITGLSQPIWIGSVHRNKVSKKTNNLDVLSYLLPALQSFSVRRVTIPKNKMHSTSLPTAPYILLIK